MARLRRKQAITGNIKDKAQKPSLGLDGEITGRGTVQVTDLDRFGSLGKAGVMVGDEILAFNNVRLDGFGLRTNGDEERIRMVSHIEEIAVAVGVGNVMPVLVSRHGSNVSLAARLKARRALSLDLDEVSEVLERKIAP